MTSQSCQIHPSKEKVFKWQARVARALFANDIDFADPPVITPLTDEGGSVIIMCGMHENALPQVMHCKSAFCGLGVRPDNLQRLRYRAFDAAPKRFWVQSIFDLGRHCSSQDTLAS